jgi:hypothetical protein
MQSILNRTSNPRCVTAQPPHRLQAARRQKRNCRRDRVELPASRIDVEAGAGLARVHDSPSSITADQTARAALCRKMLYINLSARIAAKARAMAYASDDASVLKHAITWSPTNIA